MRKGRVGAGLPFEPWDNLPSEDDEITATANSHLSASPSTSVGAGALSSTSQPLPVPSSDSSTLASVAEAFHSSSPSDTVTLRGRDTPTPTPPNMPPASASNASLATPQPLLPSQILALGSLAGDMELAQSPRHSSVERPGSPSRSTSMSREPSMEPPSVLSTTPPPLVPSVSMSPPPPVPPKDTSSIGLLAPPGVPTARPGQGIGPGILDLRLSGLGEFAVDLEPDSRQESESQRNPDGVDSQDDGELGEFLQRYGSGDYPLAGGLVGSFSDTLRQGTNSYASSYSDSYSDISNPFGRQMYCPSLSHGHSDSTSSLSLSISRSISSNSSVDSLGAIEDEPGFNVNYTVGRSDGRSVTQIQGYGQEPSGDTSLSSGDLSLTRSSSESNTSSVLHSPTGENWPFGGLTTSPANFSLPRESIGETDSDEPKSTSSGLVGDDEGMGLIGFGHGYGYGYERVKLPAEELGRRQPHSAEAQPQTQARRLLPSPAPLLWSSYDQDQGQNLHHFDHDYLYSQTDLRGSQEVIPTTLADATTTFAAEDFDPDTQLSPSPSFDSFGHVHAVPPPTPTRFFDQDIPEGDMLVNVRPHQTGAMEASLGSGKNGYARYPSVSSTSGNTFLTSGNHYATSSSFRGGQRGSQEDDEDEEENRRRRRWLAQVQGHYDDRSGSKERVSYSSDEETDDYGQPTASPFGTSFPRRAREQTRSSEHASASASRDASVAPSLRAAVIPQRFPSNSGSASVSASTSDVEESDDDVPLAQRIPGALTAQKSIRKQFKEESAARKAAKVEKTRRREAEQDIRERQMTLRPAGAGLVGASGVADMSSSQEAALLAAAAVSTANSNATSSNTHGSAFHRQRTITMPSKPGPHMPTFGFNPDDLTKKLQTVKMTEGQKTSMAPAVPSSYAQQPSMFQQQEAKGRALSHRSKRSVDLQQSSTRRPSYDLTQNAQPSPTSANHTFLPTATQSLAHRSKSIKAPSTSLPMNVTHDTATTTLPIPPLRPTRSFHRPSTDREHRTSSSSQSRNRSMTMSRGTQDERLGEKHEAVPPLPVNITSAGRSSNADPRIMSTRTSIDTDREREKAPRPSLGHVANPTIPSAPRGQTTLQRVFVGNLQQFNMVEIGATTTAGDVISLVEAGGALVGWAGSGGWMVWEIAQDFGLGVSSQFSFFKGFLIKITDRTASAKL